MYLHAIRPAGAFRQVLSKMKVVNTQENRSENMSIPTQLYTTKFFKPTEPIIHTGLKKQDRVIKEENQLK